MDNERDNENIIIIYTAVSQWFQELLSKTTFPNTMY
jgi:hypothetical protein